VRGVTALVDGLQALRVDVVLQQAAQLTQTVRDTRHEAVHTSQVTVLLAVQQFLGTHILTLII
jgi:type III secretory pathway lipoprotein EscJ